MGVTKEDNEQFKKGIEDWLDACKKKQKKG